MRNNTILRFSSPQTKGELDAVRTLLLEYANELQADLCFQNFKAELQNLPGSYAPPRGALLTAHADGELVGCCAMRPLNTQAYANACEMKRLFVRPGYRNLGLGRQLTESILNSARKTNYSCLLLDSLPEMAAARALYRDLGFVEIPAYCFNPIEGVHYLMHRL
mgnify:CR=1 FL=1